MIRSLLFTAAALFLIACGGSSDASADTSCQGAKVVVTPPSSAKVGQQAEVQVKLAIDASCITGGGDLDFTVDITDPAGNPVGAVSSTSTTVHTDPTTMEGSIDFTPASAGAYHVSGNIASGLKTFQTDVTVSN